MAGALKQVAPFGAWPSPFGAELIAAGSVRLGQVKVSGQSIYWSEGRAADGGRNVVVERDAGGRCTDRVPAPFDARTRVHEYGGLAFAAGADGELFFSHDADQRLYRVSRGGTPVPVTAASGRRFADIEIDAGRHRLIAIREDHAGVTDPTSEAVNTLVAVDLASGAETVLASGHDFFSSPRLSPDGTRLAWLTWDHPRMPWQGSELWLAELDANGLPVRPRRVAGGERESIFQPEWSPTGELHFVSDRSGWWNLYRQRAGAVQALHPMAAEFGQPQWLFGMSMYGFEPGGDIVCSYRRDGGSALARIDGDDTLHSLDIPFNVIGDLHVGAGFVAFVGASPTAAPAVVRIALDSAGATLASDAIEVVRRSSEITVAPEDVAVAEPITFPSENGAVAHAFFYAPTNGGWTGPAAKKPPLLVVSHGGPTSATTAELRLGLQYWTSRGFAVVDVDYGGSSGYGRAYRERLDGQWGVVDVDDVVAAARFLVSRGDVDGDRVAIRGSSAGGFTTLAALTFRSFFKAGASHYGISDLESLARDTHKFESRYLDSLIGPWPERADIYRARSPIHFTTQLSSALILLQGSDDKAVPPDQAETLYRAVRDRGLPVAYLLFEGEQHGFRKAATIRRALEAELFFYGRVFGFAPAGRLEPVTIDNLPSPGAAGVVAAGPP
ncbi:MAG: prolyl oligopeptidase family serine peptidase [Caldimonas sp.]